MSIENVLKSLETVERNLEAMAAKAEQEAKASGQMSTDTKAAIESIGVTQRELADRLVSLEQRGNAIESTEKADQSWGAQFVKGESLAAFQSGHLNKCRIEVKNTLTGSDTNVAPDRKPGVVPGAAPTLTLEAFLPSVPTSSNAIEFTREASFTNAAAETTEGNLKPESALTWSLVNMPVSTVAHWLKISKQLAADNAALAAYVNTRMRYGVNRRVETQLVSGNGAAPNISGVLNAGNFTAHGIANAALPAVLKKPALIRRMMADSWNAGYPADAIVLNPVDWSIIEIDLLTTAAGQALMSYDTAGNARLWGLPVIQSVGMTAGQVAVGAFGQAYIIHNRQGVVIELSDSDGDNFQRNLVTVRAERRLALATEVPAAVRAGTLTPA
jgi:HK97 family phage major capsid protein